MNPGLLDHWRTLYPQSQWAGTNNEIKKLNMNRCSQMGDVSYRMYIFFTKLSTLFCYYFCCCCYCKYLSNPTATVCTYVVNLHCYGDNHYAKCNTYQSFFLTVGTSYWIMVNKWSKQTIYWILILLTFTKT